VRFDGAGTEKIESIARAVFKGARIARMDSDLMRSANGDHNLFIIHKTAVTAPSSKGAAAAV
jgi:primosomal protein N'